MISVCWNKNWKLGQKKRHPGHLPAETMAPNLQCTASQEESQ